MSRSMQQRIQRLERRAEPEQEYSFLRALIKINADKEEMQRNPDAVRVYYSRERLERLNETSRTLNRIQMRLNEQRGIDGTNFQSRDPFDSEEIDEIERILAESTGQYPTPEAEAAALMSRIDRFRSNYRWSR